MKENKRITRFDRTRIAQEEFKKIFSSIKHPLYFAKDSELSTKFKINRHTARTLREENKAPSRSERIYNALKDLPVKDKTIKEQAALLGVKYQCLYRIIKSPRTSPEACNKGPAS